MKHLVEASPCWLGPAGFFLKPRPRGFFLKPRGRGADYGNPMEQLSLERKLPNAPSRCARLSEKRSISYPGGVTK